MPTLRDIVRVGAGVPIGVLAVLAMIVLPAIARYRVSIPKAGWRSILRLASDRM